MNKTSIPCVQPQGQCRKRDAGAIPAAAGREGGRNPSETCFWQLQFSEACSGAQMPSSELSCGSAPLHRDQSEENVL